MFRRGETFYLQDSDTGKKESLHTKDPRHAEQLRNARNEAASKPMLGLTIGRDSFRDKSVKRRKKLMDQYEKALSLLLDNINKWGKAARWIPYAGDALGLASDIYGCLK